MRNIKFRIDILRNNVFFDHLIFSSPPSIYMDSEAEIKLSLRGTFLRNPKVDYLNDEIMPVMIIDETEYPLGIYRIATMQESGSIAGVASDTIEAYDRSVILSWAKLESRDFWAKGTSYDTVIAHYLYAAGISRAITIPSSNTLQSDREDWDIGTSYLSIINTLLSEINYDPVWFDLHGNARIGPYVAPSVNNITHRYGEGQIYDVMRPEYTSSVDFFAQPNVFIAILDNPEYPEPLVARAVNDVPASKLSTISRGIRIPQVYRVSNIASFDELQSYANRMRDDSIQLSEVVSIQTANMPDHTVGDIIALNHPQLTGIFKETGWEMTLAPGQYMNHTIQRLVIA